jgi:two-component system nitrate/nitrite sensor histidine kinase NarX
VENAWLRMRAEANAASEERNRLARELHDAVTQTLFSASLIAEVAPRIWEKDPEQGRQRLDELRELTRGALAEMRTLLLELRPATLTESSLPELLRQLAEAVIGRSRLAVELTVEGEGELPPESQVVFYRIAQESLNNITKHADAGNVSIILRFEPQAVSLSVADDGRGFDAADLSPDSLGMGIMRERAAGIGAALTINSSIGEGTEVTCVWPLPENRL